MAFAIMLGSGNHLHIVPGSRIRHLPLTSPGNRFAWYVYAAV